MAGELVEGTGVQFAYNKETSWAVPNGTAYTVVRKLPAAAIMEERNQLQTAELNNRRAITGMRGGSRKTRVTIPYELSYSGDASAGSQQFDDFMESWMCNGWTAAASAIAAQTVTVGTPAAQTVFTAGTSIGTIAQGDWVKVSGYASTQLANNGYYRVVSVSSLALTLATPNYTSLVAGAADGTAVVLQRMAYISPGSTVKSLAFDAGYTNTAASLTLAKLAIGCVANTFNLSITPDQITTGSFDFMGRVFGAGATRAAAATSASLYSTISAPASWPAAATYQPMTANDTLTYLMVDNVAVGIVTSLSLSGTNDIEELSPVGAICPYALGRGNSTLTGSLDVYLIDSTYWTSFRAETAFGLSIRLMDPDTAAPGKGYAIDIPNIKITGLSENTDPKKIIQGLTWTALENAAASTKGAVTVNARVSRLT